MIRYTQANVIAFQSGMSASALSSQSFLYRRVPPRRTARANYYLSGRSSWLTIRQALLGEELFQPDEKHNFVACRLLSHRTVADSACTANEGSTAIDAHGPVGKRYAKNKLYLGQHTAYVPAFLFLYRSL